MTLCFGGESFSPHLSEARRAGVTPHIYRSITVTTDIDNPADLVGAEKFGRSTHTHKFLKSLRGAKFFDVSQKISCLK
jgi:2-phospho-L-lactate guanylyltransferase (CobY/MobA/RfbA family)